MHHPNGQPGPLDPEFAKWCEEKQVRPFDQDYDLWLSKFSQEFDEWSKEGQFSAVHDPPDI